MQISASVESVFDTFTNDIYPLCRIYLNLSHWNVSLPFTVLGRMTKDKSCIHVQRSEEALLCHISQWQPFKTTAKWKVLPRI